jgi:hypothetical protein
MLTMRKSSVLLPRAAFAACAALAACPSAGAAPTTSLAIPANNAALTQSRQQTRDVAIALRAQWLARGHSVQQLAALAPPTITGGSVTASTITVGTAGQYPSLSVAYSADTPGLSYVSVTFLSPSGETAYGGSYSTWYYTQTGTVSFAIVTPLGLYAQPGNWSLASATLVDNAGNSTTYTASQLQALFTNLSFTVVNTGPSAKAPPKIKSGALLNDTVSLSAKFPVLAANITASDKDGPGIYQAYVLIQPPGQTYSYYSFLPNALPMARGKVHANNVFASYSPTGTYAIVGFGVCDYANNCSGSNSDAAVVALFGTDSFTVTP